MADVLVSVGGHAYRLACREGEEAALRSAARLLDARAIQLSQSLGALTEARLLLMAGLMVAGEQLEGPANGADPGVSAAQANGALSLLVARVEALADRLEVMARGVEPDGNRA
jgi:cell division protein ZapA